MRIPSLLPLSLLLLPLTTAHVKLHTPTPYTPTHLTTNALLTTGLDYPCAHLPSTPPFNYTTIPHLTPQPLTFIGQATHGGGSCQISLSRDIPPNLTASSVFKVLKSIEGSCPSSHAGNVGTDPEGFGADGFEYVVPEGVGEGEFTLAWTWFNRIGEREMYMNCAPVRVVKNAGGGTGGAKAVRKRGKGRRGGGDEEGFWEGLPDMFRANVGNGCRTAESGTTLGFPEGNLGKVVQRIGNEELVPPVGDCGVGEGVVEGAETPAEVVPAVQEPSPSSSSSSASTTSPVAASDPFLPSPHTHQPSAAVPPANQPPAFSSSSPPPPANQPALAPASDLNPLPTSTCPEVGKSVCSPDGKSWGTCMADHTVIFQPVAQGTRCDAALGVEVVG